MIKRRVSEFQFDTISENTKVGIQEAKLKGKNTGCPKNLLIMSAVLWRCTKAKSIPFSKLPKRRVSVKDNWNDFEKYFYPILNTVLPN